MKVLKLLVPMIFGLCFFCRSAMVCTQSVAAADPVLYTLTAEQTLALYGRTLDGTYYDAQRGYSLPIHYTYAFTLENWRPNDYTATPTYIHSFSGGGVQNNSDGINIKYNLEHSTFLVYYLKLNDAWNAEIYPFPSSNNPNHSNVSIDFNFPVEFTNITTWENWFMWLIDPEASNYPSEYSYVTNVTGSDSVLRKYPYYYWYSSNYYHRLNYAQFPCYKAISTETITETLFNYCGVIRNYIPLANTTYDLRNQTVSLNCCYAFNYKNSGSNLPFYGEINGSQKSYLLCISCPRVSSADPMPDLNETTTAATGTGIGTTASYQTYPTVDLSGLESGVGTMVQMQDEGNYYQRIQIDQLNMIIQQLDSIYAQMVRNGEVPVSLTAADAAKRFDTSILDQVNSAATSYTIAQLPQDYAGNGATGIGAFIAQVVGVDPIFMTIGLFSIGFAIFCWFVFRGRGGV